MFGVHAAIGGSIMETLLVALVVDLRVGLEVKNALQFLAHSETNRVLVHPHRQHVRVVHGTVTDHHTNHAGIFKHFANRGEQLHKARTQRDHLMRTTGERKSKRRSNEHSRETRTNSSQRRLRIGSVCSRTCEIQQPPSGNRSQAGGLVPRNTLRFSRVCRSFGRIT
jgi:hypothetical protein